MADKADFFTYQKQQDPEAATKSNDFFNIPSPQQSWVPEEPPSTIEQLKNAPLLAAREAKAGIFSLPHSTAEIYRFLAGKLQGLGEDLAAKEGREISESEREMTDKFVNYLPDLVSSLNEKFPSIFPTYQQAREKATEQLEKTHKVKLPEKGRGFIERAAEGAGSAVETALFPSSLLTKGAIIGTQALTEGLDLPPGYKLAANLTVPAIASFANAIRSGKYIPKPGEAERALEAGKSLGMSMEELAPILASEEQVARHGRRAASISKTQKSFKKTGDALGTALENLQSQPIAKQKLGTQATEGLVSGFENILEDLTSGSHALGPKSEKLVEFIRNTIIDIDTNGTTPKQLIGTWREINKIGEGKTFLRRLMPYISEGIESVDPKLAKDFLGGNLLYKRFIQNLGEIKPGQYNAFMDAGELQQVLGSVFQLQPETTAKGILRFLTLQSLEKISSSIITNPKAQSLVRNFGKAVKSGSKKAALNVAHQLKEYVKKELPDEYDKVDWDALDVKG